MDAFTTQKRNVFTRKPKPHVLSRMTDSIYRKLKPVATKRVMAGRSTVDPSIDRHSSLSALTVCRYLPQERTLREPSFAVSANLNHQTKESITFKPNRDARRKAASFNLDILQGIKVYHRGCTKPLLERMKWVTLKKQQAPKTMVRREGRRSNTHAE